MEEIAGWNALHPHFYFAYPCTDFVLPVLGAGFNYCDPFADGRDLAKHKTWLFARRAANSARISARKASRVFITASCWISLCLCNASNLTACALSAGATKS
jgi:hypothetical protein